MKQRQLCHLTAVTLFGVLYASLSGPQVACQEASQGTDLFARNLKGWTRSGGGKSPWTLTTTGVLRCEAVKDSYTTSDEFGDGTLYLQWRFIPTADKKLPTASVTLRTVGEQGVTIDLGQEAGTLSTSIQASSDKVRTLTIPAPENTAKKVGEWNSLKVVCQKQEIHVTVNGKQVTSTTECTISAGSLVFHAQGHAVEFRDVRWKEAK